MTEPGRSWQSTAGWFGVARAEMAPGSHQCFAVKASAGNKALLLHPHRARAATPASASRASRHPRSTREARQFSSHSPGTPDPLPVATWMEASEFEWVAHPGNAGRARFAFWPPADVPSRDVCDLLSTPDEGVFANRNPSPCCAKVRGLLFHLYLLSTAPRIPPIRSLSTHRAHSSPRASPGCPV